jgi:hypothetical protein
MGLRMNSWTSLHVGLVMLLPFLLSFFLGCKKVESKPEDLGPVTDVREIESALSKIVSDASFDGIDVGRFAYATFTQRLENNEVVENLGDLLVTVAARKDPNDVPDNEVHFILRIDRQERLPDQKFEKTQTEETLKLRRAGLLALLDRSGVSALTEVGSFASAGSLLTAASVDAVKSRSLQASQRPPVRTTFHRFRQSTGVVPVPASARARPNCGGVASCQLNVHYMQFDIVSWYSDTEYQKVSVDWAFSTDTPFLPFGERLDDQLFGMMLTGCASTYVSIPDRRVYVRQCWNLEDFQK